MKSLPDKLKLEVALGLKKVILGFKILGVDRDTDRITVKSSRVSIESTSDYANFVIEMLNDNFIVDIPIYNKNKNLNFFNDLDDDAVFRVFIDGWGLSELKSKYGDDYTYVYFNNGSEITLF